MLDLNFLNIKCYFFLVIFNCFEIMKPVSKHLTNLLIH